MEQYKNMKDMVKMDEESKGYEFERSLLYKYMVYSFQYVDPCSGNYKSKRNFVLFKLDRIVMTLLIWLIVGFAIFYSIETRYTTYIDALTNRDIILIGRTVGSIWQIFNYNLGLYLFYKYPYKIQKELEEMIELVKTNESKGEMNQKLRCCRKSMLRFMVTSFITFVVLRYLAAFVYLAVDGKISLRVIHLIGVALHRMLSLPFLLYFVFLARLQVVKLNIFTKSLESQNLTEQRKDIIESYLGICSSIKKTNKEYHIYVVFLVVFLCINVLRTTNVIAGDIDLIEKGSNLTALEIMYHVKGTVEAAIDIILYVVVLVIVSRVAHAQRNILKKLLKQKNQDFDVRLDAVVFLQTHHHLEGTGYSIFGIPITGMRALLFAVFVSLSGFIGRLLLTI